MKKISLAFVLVILSTIATFSFAFAEEVVWEKTILENSEFLKETYSRKDDDSTCIIHIFKDERRIGICAIDFNYYGTILSQVVEINSAEKTVEDRSYEIIKSERLMKRTYGYDIFYLKFLPYAKDLPPEIQAKFDGHWGIK